MATPYCYGYEAEWRAWPVIAYPQRHISQHDAQQALTNPWPIRIKITNQLIIKHFSYRIKKLQSNKPIAGTVT